MSKSIRELIMCYAQEDQIGFYQHILNFARFYRTEKAAENPECYLKDYYHYKEKNQGLLRSIKDMEKHEGVVKRRSNGYF